MGGRSGASVLVTMCGKTVDIPWLCEKGHSVTGVELSPVAVQQLFQENSIPYTVSGEWTKAVVWGWVVSLDWFLSLEQIHCSTMALPNKASLFFGVEYFFQQGFLYQNKQSGITTHTEATLL